MTNPFQYQFEWDPVKARQNLQDHGIAFERAATVFWDPHALSEFDEEHSQDEDRWIILGIDRTGSLLVVWGAGLFLRKKVVKKAPNPDYARDSKS